MSDRGQLFWVTLLAGSALRAGGGGVRHTWLAVSSTADQRRNKNLVEFGKPSCVKTSGLYFVDFDSGWRVLGIVFALY